MSNVQRTRRSRDTATHLLACHGCYSRAATRKRLEDARGLLPAWRKLSLAFPSLQRAMDDDDDLADIEAFLKKDPPALGKAAAAPAKAAPKAKVTDRFLGASAAPAAAAAPVAKQSEPSLIDKFLEQKAADEEAAAARAALAQAAQAALHGDDDEGGGPRRGPHGRVDDDATVQARWVVLRSKPNGGKTQCGPSVHPTDAQLTVFACFTDARLKHCCRLCASMRTWRWRT